jgi:predicted TIM-barrel fold metal-dependent hydrolase
MIIDAHNHAEWCGYTLKRTLENMDKYNIDVTWILTWECPEDEYATWNYPQLSPRTGSKYPIPFSQCLAFVEQAPDRFVLGYAPDPRRPDAIDRLSAAIDMYGVRTYGELKIRATYDNPDALRMFKFCGEKGLPVTVHMDYPLDFGVTYPRPNYWYGGTIEALERAIQACPETIFLGHAPGFWSHISGDDQFDKESYPQGKVVPGGKVVSMLRQYPNLYCDWSAGSGLNALKRDPEFAKDFLLEFQDRMLYARDDFNNDHQEFLNSLGLPADVLAKIYSGNALKLVPLG